MKDKILEWFETRLFTWSTAIGIIIILFFTSYSKELSDLIKWILLYPARQLITNIVSNQEFTSRIVEGIAILVGGLLINCKRKN